MIIFLGSLHMEHWFSSNIQDKTLFAVSDTGYTNDELTFEWLTYFEEYSRQHQLSVWRLLICNGYGSHCTYEFLDYCNCHKIIPFCFSAHATHIMQPFNVVVFEPYKHYYAKAVDAATQTSCSNFNKIKFLAAITSIQTKTF